MRQSRGQAHQRGRWGVTVLSAVLLTALPGAAFAGAPAAGNKPSELEQTTRRTALLTVFNEEALEELCRGAGLQATVVNSVGGSKSVRVPLRLEGIDMTLELTIAPGEPDSVVVGTLPVGWAKSRSALERAVARDGVGGVKVSYGGAGLLTLSIARPGSEFYNNTDAFRRQRQDLEGKLAAEMDEDRKKALAAEVKLARAKELTDIRLRLRPDALKSLVGKLTTALEKHPEFFDTTVWQPALSIATVGQPKVDAGLTISPDLVHAGKRQYPWREGDQYHELYKWQQHGRTDYFHPENRWYTSTVAKTEKWRSSLPNRTPYAAEANPGAGSYSERNAMDVMLTRTTYLNQLNRYYDTLLADRTKFVGTKPAFAPEHHYRDPNMVLPQQHFDNRLRLLPDPFYTGTAGKYRDARFYDAAQKRPIWAGY